MKNIKVLGTGCANCKTAMEFIEDEKGEIATAGALASALRITPVGYPGMAENPGVDRKQSMKPIADFWQMHHARLRSYIAKRVRDAVDDILQEVFLKVNAGLHTVKSQGAISAWLYRVAANSIADHYRSQKPWEELPGDDELASPAAERDYVAELATCLQPFIADLPETYRSALQLSEIEGLPQKEVARRLGVSLSGAKSRVQRGREKLRQRVLDCCHIETGRSGIIGYEPRVRNCGIDCG